MEQPVIIFGAGGLGILTLEIFQSNGVIVYGFLDDNQSIHSTEVGEVPVLGSTDDPELLELIGKKCQAFIAEDNEKIKATLVNMLMKKRKTMPINAIHQQAYLSSSATLGHGNLISAGVILNAQGKMGSHCIFNTGCTIEFGAEIKDFVQIGAGSIVGPSAQIGEGAFVGAGVTIVSSIKIGAKARIGAGSVVVRDVASKETVFGNPAQTVESN